MNRTSELSRREPEFASNHIGRVFEASYASDRPIVDMDDGALLDAGFHSLDAAPGEWIEVVELGAGRAKWNVVMGASIAAAAASALCLATPPVRAENNWLPLKKFHSAFFSGSYAKQSLQKSDAVAKVAAIDASNDGITNAKADALAFASSIPDGLPRCDVWTDQESEIVFEWKLRNGGHAVVSCEGDGVIGYTMRIAGRFESGDDLDPPAGHFPADLKAYLLAFA